MTGWCVRIWSGWRWTRCWNGWSPKDWSRPAAGPGPTPRTCWGAIRHLNRLELAGETLRAALEALAVAHPGWLTQVIDPAWQQVYGARIDNLHLPTSATKRTELMVAYGRDGYHLLDQMYSPSAPTWLREVPAVQVLRRVWIQQFYRDVDTTTGRQEVRRREAAPDGDGLPPGHLKIISPYDVDARYSLKRDTGWGGYKVHFTETCNAPARGEDRQEDDQPDQRPGDLPNLITNVVTTTATVPDVAMTDSIHQQLADRDLLPGPELLSWWADDDGQAGIGAGEWRAGGLETRNRVGTRVVDLGCEMC